MTAITPSAEETTSFAVRPVSALRAYCVFCPEGAEEGEETV